MFRLLIVFVVLGAIAAAAYKPIKEYWQERNRPTWRTTKVESGKIVAVKNSTGTVKPVLEIKIGSFVSGPITKLAVDFNDEVKEGDLLAKVDPELFEANVAREEASLATRVWEVERVEAQLDQAINNEKRGMRLQEENADFISEAEMDTLIFTTRSARAQLKLAKSAVDQAKASLQNAERNLQYTDIRATEDGIVIDRKIDPGQTLAAQFQTPELFVVAVGLREHVHVFASVDEADIGFIQKAQDEERAVSFTVDAHPEDLFTGKIAQIRLSSTTLQNVVTYPVVVEAPNPGMKLLPGMTASISFEIDAKDDVLKIPNAALRFYPDSKHVRKEDRGILDGSAVSSDGDQSDAENQSAAEKTAAHKKLDRRHVWVADGDSLRAVEIVTGLMDSRYSECVSGDLKEGDELVTGIKPK